MWHTESIDCFDSHFSGSSSFLCHRDEEWLTRITLRYWSLNPHQSQTERDGGREPTPNSAGPFQIGQEECWVGYQSDFDEERMCISLPESLAKALKEGSRTHDQLLYKAVPKVSSIIISTNPFGDFGKCSTISEILPECIMVHLCENAKEVWQKFVHQSQTGRCLIFLLFLGSTCQAMARKYREALGYFVRLIKLDVCDNLSRHV